MEYGYAKAASSMLRGCEAIPVCVEAQISDGLPALHIIGMPDTEVIESAQRVKCAIKSSGFSWPKANVTVNLLPSNMKKRGSEFDLAIAAAILAASWQIAPERLEGRTFSGELALGGEAMATLGFYCRAMSARAAGLELVCPADGPRPEGSRVLGIGHLAELREIGEPSETATARSGGGDDPGRAPNVDMADIPGMERVKRAAAIAAAGGHGLLLVGPPGTGKTMIARRIATIMPEWKGKEREEAAAAWSAAGLDVAHVLSERPFRSPHHSSTIAGLVGGGRPVRPGEASLAHGGVLYLDDVQEFGPRQLMALRAVLEDGRASIARADGVYDMPAEFLLVASAIPCPCGHFGTGRCTCTERHVAEYRKRLCGPLADKFDIMVELAAQAPGTADGTTSSAELASQVEAAVKAAESRTDAPEVLSPERAADPGFARIMRVARTIADLDGCREIDGRHVEEALSYRVRL